MAPRKKSEEVLDSEGVEQPITAEPTGFYATKDFEIASLGIRVQAGERFQVPAEWQRDVAAEELCKVEKQKGGNSFAGMIFNYQGEVINPNERNQALRERRTHTVLLPLEMR